MMIKGIITSLRASVAMLLLCTVLLGGFYPLLCTALLQLTFPNAANGSLILRADQVVGSELIGQNFTSARYFWGRPSGSPQPYDATSSSGSNLSPSNPTLREAVAARIEALTHADRNNKKTIPADLVNASASGLDPHITLAAAEYQISRVAKTRGISENAIRALIEQQKETTGYGVFGTPYINVVMLNLALDDIETSTAK